jgi:hypothetical protein
MFPDARFVHIVRNPYKVFPSTIRLWQSLAEKHGVQTPNHLQVREKVLSTFPHLYARLEEGKKLIAPSRFHEMKYEDLIRDPVGQMNQLYDHLDLDEFDNLRIPLSKFIVENANYETNKFT